MRSTFVMISSKVQDSRHRARAPAHSGNPLASRSTIESLPRVISRAIRVCTQAAITLVARRAPRLSLVRANSSRALTVRAYSSVDTCRATARNLPPSAVEGRSEAHHESKGRLAARRQHLLGAVTGADGRLQDATGASTPRSCGIRIVRVRIPHCRARSGGSAASLPPRADAGARLRSGDLTLQRAPALRHRSSCAPPGERWRVAGHSSACCLSFS